MNSDIANFNLKIRRPRKKKFKDACYKNGSTMQSVLSSFIDLYIENPKKFRIKMETIDMDTTKFKSLATNSNMTAGTKDLDYKEIKMKNFEVRQVKIENSERGLFHLNGLNGMSDNHFIEFFRSKLPECQVGLVDPSETLRLPYPIFIAVDDQMKIESMEEFFKQTDEEINKQT